MTKAKSFEQMMDELEEILATLERGDMPLEEMMKLYAKGVKLADSCRARLYKAEQEISVEGGQI